MGRHVGYTAHRRCSSFAQCISLEAVAYDVILSLAVGESFLSMMFCLSKRKTPPSFFLALRLARLLPTLLHTFIKRRSTSKRVTFAMGIQFLATKFLATLERLRYVIRHMTYYCLLV